MTPSYYLIIRRSGAWAARTHRIDLESDQYQVSKRKTHRPRRHGRA